MTYIAKPPLHHPSLEKNALGFTRRDYEGRISTLCAGCGHDSISASIIQACFEIDLAPHRLLYPTTAMVRSLHLTCRYEIALDQDFELIHRPEATGTVVVPPYIGDV